MPEDHRLSKAFRKFLTKHGDELIDTFVVYRAPLDGVTNALLHLITAGQWDKIKERGGVDKLFHTYAVINGRYLFEKTALPILKEVLASGVSNTHAESMPAPVQRMTIREFMERAIRAMNLDFFRYDAFHHRSCQDFLYGALQANGMMVPALKLFLLQDVERLVEETPAFSKWIARVVTDTAGETEHAYRELTEKRGGIRHRMDHGRRHRM